MVDLSLFKTDAEKVLEVVRDDMSTIKTGRAKPSLVDSLPVEAYGSRMKIMELATISAPDPTLLIIKPWDKSMLNAIQKGISAAPLGINPIVDGDQIRIVIPPLTQERREEMVKLVKQKLESGKQILRDVRIKHKKLIDDQEGEPGVSEDDIRAQLDQLQKLMEEYTKKLEEIAAEKEKELMQV